MGRIAVTFASAALLLAGLGVASPSLAQDGGDAVPETRVDDIVVDGRPLEVVAEEFVREVSAPPRGRGIARWTGPICIGVVNFRTEAAHLIIDRMSATAEGLGLELGEPGCEANLIIVGADDADGLAQEMVRRQRSSFFRFGYTRSNRGSADLAEFQTTDAPVRWWHLSLPVYAGTDTPAIRLPGENYAPWPCRFRGAPGRDGIGRRCNLVSDKLFRLIVIVDVAALPEMSFQQLGDYLTMIGLAQIDPDGDWARHDTILNIMASPETVSGLTDWDLAYLQALYSGKDELLEPEEQAARLTERLR